MPSQTTHTTHKLLPLIRRRPAYITAVIVAILGSIFIWRSFAAVEPSATDLNGDGSITITDLSMLLTNYGKSGTGLKGDVNADNSVNISDLSLLLANWGKSVDVTTPTIPPSDPPSTSDPKPNGAPGDWKLVFNDDFDGTSLDLTKWQMCNASFRSGKPCLPWNKEQQIFNTAATGNNNVKVSGGQLHLIATKENGQIYSGMISTAPDKWGFNNAGYKPFMYKYGLYEGRIKWPKGNGFWPSLWQLPDQEVEGCWPKSGEYDVVEIPGNDPTEGHFTVHRGDVCDKTIMDQNEVRLPDTSNGFHTFALDWQADGFTWYFDGKKIATAGAAWSQTHPFYIIANFSVGGSWPPLHGAPDGSTPFPASMDIDYLRVWQHP